MDFKKWSSYPVFKHNLVPLRIESPFSCHSRVCPTLCKYEAAAS